jgi:acyl dehydratase
MNVQPCTSSTSSLEDRVRQRIVNSLFTLGLMIGITVNDTTLGTTIANLGMTDVRSSRLPWRHAEVRPRS